MDVTAVAARLEGAARSGVPIEPVRDELGAADVAAAYAVQRELTRRRLAAGARVVGRKIGLTSPAVQAQLGVDQPDVGTLFADMQVPDGGTAPIARLLQPRAEAEVAFVLGADLAEGPLDDAECRAAVASACAAIEIVDSRIAGWRIGIVDTVADNASSGLFVLGARRLPLHGWEPREVGMTMTVDGVEASAGSGRACLGDPLTALRWLARTARDAGDPLRAGQIVLSGALGPMVAIAGGEHVVADVGPLGRVSVTFGRRSA